MSESTLSRPRWWSSPPPAVAIGLTSTTVSAVRVERDADALVVRASTSVALPTGALVPALNAANVVDRPAVVAAVRQALAEVGPSRRVALVVPDSAAKVSFVRFDAVSARGDDLEALVRWQVRKSAPFPVDSAQVAIVPGVSLDGAAREFVVTVMRRDLVEEYEAVVDEVGAHAGLVDIATPNVVNLALASSRAAGDVMVIHLAADDHTLAIVREGALIFLRSRAAHEPDLDLLDSVHQATMYHQDRLKGKGFGEVILVGGPTGDERVTLVEAVADRLGQPVRSIDASAVVRFADRVSVNGALIDRLAGPLGVILRES